MCYKGKCSITIRSTLKNKKCFDINNKVFSGKYLLCSSKKIRYTTKVALKKLIRVIVPSTFSSIVLPIATMVDSFLIINILIKSGFSSQISTSLYGLMGGVVQSLISLPTIIIAGVSTSIVPSLSGVVAGSHDGDVDKKVAFFIKITLVLAVLMTAILFVFAQDILKFLYGDGLGHDVIDEIYYATKMLQISSINILYYSFLQTFTAILQAIGKPQIPFLVLLVCLGVRICLTLVLVAMPNLNIFGAIIAHVLFLGVANILLVFFIKKSINFELKLFNNLLKPLLSGVVVMLLMYVVHGGLRLIINYFVSMIITCVLGITIYVLWIYFGRVFNDKEKRSYFRKTKKLSK